MRDLIASGDTLTAGEIPSKTRLARGFKGARQGTWIILSGLLAGLFLGILSAADDVFAVLLLLPLLCIVVGFCRILYGVFVQGRAEKEKELPSRSTAIPVWNEPAGLPPGNAPVDEFMRPIKKTAEVAQPPSVTENTTKFLDE